MVLFYGMVTISGLILATGDDVWMTVLGYQEDGKGSRQSAERVLSSVSVE